VACVFHRFHIRASDVLSQLLQESREFRLENFNQLAQQIAVVVNPDKELRQIYGNL